MRLRAMLFTQIAFNKSQKEVTIMKGKNIKLILIILIIEKIIQHLYTSISFIVNKPQLGIIDISPYMGINRPTLAILNFIMVSILAASIYYLKRKNTKILSIILGVAIFDIIAEFIFHGFFFITVSVIISTIIVFFLHKYKKYTLLS